MVVEYIGEQWVKYKINRWGSTTLGPAPLPAGAEGGGVERPLLALWPMCSVGRRSPVHAHGALGVRGEERRRRRVPSNDDEHSSWQSGLSAQN